MALAGKFNAHVHVEYEWRLHHEDMDESDEDLEDKVRVRTLFRLYTQLHTMNSPHTHIIVHTVYTHT